MMPASFMADVYTLLPEIVLALGTMALMIIGVMGRGGALKPVATLSVILWVVAGACVLLNDNSVTTRIFNDMLIIDGFAAMAKILVLGGSVAALLIAVRDLQGTILARFEYPVLMGFSALGMCLMASANDLITLYVGLELSSLSLYVLASFDRNNAASSEAGLKYFVLGAISSGLLLFGSSLIYGYTGSTQFDVIQLTIGAASVPGPAPVILLFGMVLVISAIAFKIAAVPFHMWTPDVYEGAPTSVTAFFAIVPKLAAMVLLIRLLIGPFAPLTADWTPIISLMAVASMLVGSFAAIVQTSIKRLLAYSSIGNVGYALIGVTTGSHIGLTSVLVYLTIYMVTSVAVFGVVLMLRKNGAAVTRLSDLAGLSKAHPGYAYVLAGLMFSMAGIPPLAGFFGKLAVFQAAVASQAYILAVIGVLTSVVAAWYYINVIRMMFFENAEEGEVTTLPSVMGILMVMGSMVFVCGFILMPSPVSNFAAQASAALLR